jgi:hypothetical protein
MKIEDEPTIIFVNIQYTLLTMVFVEN